MKTKKLLMTKKEPHLIQPWIIQSKAKFGFTQRVVFRPPLKIINSWNVIQRNNQVMPARLSLYSFNQNDHVESLMNGIGGIHSIP